MSDWEPNPKDFLVSDMIEKGRQMAVEKAARDRDEKIREIELNLGRPIQVVRQEMVPTETGYDFKYWYL